MGHDESGGRLLRLNATAASLLGLLHRGPMTGWDLARLAETVTGDFWNVSHSQIYRELRALDEAGLVHAGPSGTRDRRPFTITEAGRGAFAVWLRREPGPDIIRSPLLLMVSLASHLDEVHLRRFLAIHRLRHEQTLDEYHKVAADLGAEEPDLANVLQFAIFHEEAVLRWFEWLDGRRGGGAPDPGAAETVSQ